MTKFYNWNVLFFTKHCNDFMSIHKNLNFIVNFRNSSALYCIVIYWFITWLDPLERSITVTVSLTVQRSFLSNKLACQDICRKLEMCTDPLLIFITRVIIGRDYWHPRSSSCGSCSYQVHASLGLSHVSSYDDESRWREECENIRSTNQPRKNNICKNKKKFCSYVLIRKTS